MPGVNSPLSTAREFEKKRTEYAKKLGADSISELIANRIEADYRDDGILNNSNNLLTLKADNKLFTASDFTKAYQLLNEKFSNGDINNDGRKDLIWNGPNTLDGPSGISTAFNQQNKKFNTNTTVNMSALLNMDPTIVTVGNVSKLATTPVETRKIFSHDIESLKEKFDILEQKIEHFETAKTEKNKKRLRAENERLKEELEKAHENNNQQKPAHAGLEKQIQDLTAQVARQAAEIDRLKEVRLDRITESEEDLAGLSLKAKSELLNQALSKYNTDNDSEINKILNSVEEDEQVELLKNAFKTENETIMLNAADLVGLMPEENIADFIEIGLKSDSESVREKMYTLITHLPQDQVSTYIDKAFETKNETIMAIAAENIEYLPEDKRKDYILTALELGDTVAKAALESFSDLSTDEQDEIRPTAKKKGFTVPEKS